MTRYSNDDPKLLILIRACNDKGEGGQISRREMLQATGDAYKMQAKKTFAVDTYRGYLVRLGYLKRMPLFKYKILKEIPLSLTPTKLMEELKKQKQNTK